MNSILLNSFLYSLKYIIDYLNKLKSPIPTSSNFKLTILMGIITEYSDPGVYEPRSIKI